MNTSTTQQALTLFAAALTHHQAGRLPEAQPLYEQGLQFSPDNPDALFLLGQVLFERGDAQRAEQLSRRAIALQPLAKYHYGLALQLFNRGDYAAARPAFASALQHDPTQADFRRGLSRTLEQLGEISAALALWQEAPTALSAEAHYQQARFLEQLAQYQDALAHLAGEPPTNLPINPGDWYALRAHLHEQQKNTAAALQDRLHAIAANPQDALLRGQLALSLMQQGLFTDALTQFEESVRLAPEHGQLHFNHALALARLGQFAAARAAYTTAIRHTEGKAQAPILTNLANLLSEEGPEQSLPEALALYQQAISLDPRFVPAYYNLGMWYLSAGQRLDACTALTHAATLEPDNGLIAAHLVFQQLHLCQWQDLPQLQQKVIASIERDSADISPFIVLALPHSSAALQRRCSENHARRLAKPPLVNSAARAKPMPSEQKRLRLGYFSADFKNHATVYLMIEMLEAHQRSRFEIFALSYGINDHSPMRQRLEHSVEHFIELADLPESEAIQRIAELNLDILIDLKGYTEGNKSAYLRYRLAPVQINWLGYPSTLGAPWVDYLIADRTLIPPKLHAAYSEKILYLPHSYQPNARQRAMTAAPTRADEGLAEEAIVLCSFNQTYKITPAIFACWLAVLRDSPAAVLWLWASNPWAEHELRRHATNAGIAATRLIFAAGRAQAEHLARLALADLALDTFPCNGHTTTSDALWAGVPVITLQGETMASRVAASLLHTAQFDELIYDDLARYQQGIVRFCHDASWRADLQTRARRLRTESPLFDAVQFARQLEDLLHNLVAQSAKASPTTTSLFTGQHK